ncbi:MAG: hypothetical protein JWO46_1515 [Nocardioidaceae bacterium]|nr:hypothetical protein [Nocardioidaceae bacterium]
MVSVLTRRMRPTRLVIAFALLIGPLALAGTLVAPADARVPAAVTAQPPATAKVAATKNPAKNCKGIKFKKVKGERPAYASKLRTYPARNATCRAYWASGANSDFVPQAVAIEGTTAWISGYTWPTSSNLCRIERMDLVTGQVIAQQSSIYALKSDGTPDYYCRHGGGLTVDQYGMWISASGELWLLSRFAIGYDPDHVVLRHWSVDQKSGVHASINTTSGGYAMLGYYSGDAAASNVSWVSQDALMKTGVNRITMNPTGPGDIAPVLQQPIRAASQGLNWYQGLVTTQCGGATFANGKHVSLIPGIEDIEFVPETKKTYLISESGSRPLHTSGSIVPFLSEVSTKKIKQLRATHC